MTAETTISVDQRDVLYDRILVHLADINQVWLAVRAKDYEEADCSGRLASDELRLVLDDLGWGGARGRDRIKLTTPPDVVRRVAELLRELASAEETDEHKSREALQIAEEESRQVREMCDGLLVALDGAPVASGEPGDG